MIPEPLQFNGNDLNNALRKDPALKLDIEAEKSAPNQFGIYHDTYRPRRGGSRKTHCYYACEPGKEHVHAPPIGKWHDTIPSLPELQKECEALARSTRTLRELPHGVIDIVARARCLAEERPTKRTRLDEDADNASRLSSLVPSTETSKSSPLEVVGVAPPESSQPAVQKLPAGTNIYWDSADARKLFGASDNETSLNRLDDLIEVLEHVNKSPSHIIFQPSIRKRKSKRAGKERQKAWSKSCGREDGLIQIGRARITASLGQRTQWD
jgi:hypothetical protein